MTYDEYKKQIAQMSKAMFRYCLSRTSSYHDAQDLAQEILLISCKGENSFPNEKAFYAFVWRTADNILKRWYRDSEKRNMDELDESISDNSWQELEEQAQENEQLSLIARELSMLSSNYRKVTVAYYIDGLSVRDISEKFEITQSMVKYLLFQSRKKIKEGVIMERTYGKLSYDPIDLGLFFWGGKNRYYGKFDSKLRQNILMCCYYDKQSEEQIALQLGVPTAYLEDDLKKLKEYGLIIEKNGFYQCNVPIITKEVFDEISKANKGDVKKIAASVRSFIDDTADKVRELGFYGCDMPQNNLKWMLLSLILHLSYIDIPHEDMPLDFPVDIFGEKCFRFFTERTSSDPYGVGTSAVASEYGTILFWDVCINGEFLHPKMTLTRADMSGKLLSSQPQTENEKLVCSELIELGLAVKTEEGIKPNFPCLTKEQGDKLNEMICGIGKEISQNILSRTEKIRQILIDHSPAHLADYVSKMALLLHYKETEDIMQELVESGWLLPMKGGMNGSTVMYLR